MQVVRTVAEDMYDSVPRGDFRILESYLRALSGARELVYLENQFLWSPELVEVLAAKLRHPPADSFRLVVVLPRRANNGQDDTRGQLARLVAADGGQGRFLAATLRSRSGTRADPLYVHAKVGIVDDRWLTVGTRQPERPLPDERHRDERGDRRRRAGARHARAALGRAPRAASRRRQGPRPAGARGFEEWIPVAGERLQRERDGSAPTHRLIALPGVSRRSARLLGPLTGLIDDG